MPSFTKKVYIDKKDGGTPVLNEPIVVPSNTIDIVYLEHDNAHDTTCFSGLNSSGTPLTGDITPIEHPDFPWRLGLQFSANAVASFQGQTVYVNYITDGDMVEVEVINRLEEQVEFLTNTGGGSGLAVQVVSTSPSDSDLDVEVNSNIDITINKWIDDEQIGYLNNLKVYSDSARTTEILGLVTQLNKKTLRFNPNSNLDFTALVYPRLLAGLKAVDGMALENNYDFSFQTASAPPNDSPVISYFGIKSGTMLRTGVTLEWDYTDTESNPITSIEIYEDGVLHGTMTSAGSKNGNNRYEIIIAATPNYNYGSSHNYYIKIKDAYNDWTISSTVTGNIPANQAPTTPTITASIDNGGDITFRVTNSPITDNESDTMTATIFVDGVALTGYTNVPFTSVTWNTNTVLDTSFALSTTHTIRIEIYDGYNTVSSNTVSGLTVVANTAPTSTIATSGVTFTQMTVNGVISGIGAGDSINKIRVAYALNGTDTTADQAVTAGRYFDITVAGDITNFQGAGYTKTSLNLNGTYIPYIQITENMSGGGTQTGSWSSGTSFTKTNQAPTASPTISGTTTKGSTLTVSVGYADTESDPAGTHLYQWYYDSQVSGATKAVISGATANTYVIAEAYVGKYIFCEVTPKATSGTLTGTPTLSAGTLIPIPAPPSLDIPTAGDGKITNTFTQNATLTTETYFAIYTTDGSTPTLSPLNGTRINGITSPFDITSVTTVKVALGMTVNGVDSALSTVVSSTPVVTLFSEPFTGTDGTLPSGYEIVRINNATQGAGGVIQILSNQLKVYGQSPDGGATWVSQMLVKSDPVDLSTDRTFKLKIGTKQTTGSLHFRVYETKPNNTWNGFFPSTLSRTFGITFDNSALYKQYYDSSDAFINASIDTAPTNGTVIEFRYHKAANTFDIYYGATAKVTGLAIKSGWTQCYVAIGIAVGGVSPANGAIVDDLVVI